MPTSRRLPDFPWDTLAGARQRASSHPAGFCDLSVGTPVDDTPEVVRRALIAAANAPGYPLTHGTAALRAAVVQWFERRLGIAGLDPQAVLPTIGSKEFVAWLPTLLGLGTGDVVGHPALAYPTYDVGARLAGATPRRYDALTEFGPQRPALLWVNSPANPHGQILGIEHLAKTVAWARETGTIVASDECYLELAWDAEAVSILDPRVNGGSLDGLLAVHSLSKRSNLAGYRAGFVAGDPRLVATLLDVSKHAGMMVPTPVQAAAAAALGDDAHVDEQRARYAARRTALREALLAAGFTLEHSAGGLYLWATRGEPCRTTVDVLADIGVLVTPGDFYGPRGSEYIRVAITATDDVVAAAATRIAEL